VSHSAPARHRQLLLLNHIVGDGGTTIPCGHLPFQHHAVSANLAGLRPPRGVWPVRHLDIDEGIVCAELVLSSDGVGSAVVLAAVGDCEEGVAILSLHREVATGLNMLAVLLPNNLWLRVASEWNLHHGILSLVKEGRVAEPWWNIQPWWLLDLELSLG